MAPLLSRIADLKKLHAGNGNTLAYLDQSASALRQSQLDAVKAASARAVESFERDYKPRFAASLKARDLPAARRAMNELLFSPACTSFDAYLNFEERAQDFRRALGARDVAPGASG